MAYHCQNMFLFCFRTFQGHVAGFITNEKSQNKLNFAALLILLQLPMSRQIMHNECVRAEISQSRLLFTPDTLLNKTHEFSFSQNYNNTQKT